MTTERYQPSGKVHWAVFLPLALGTLLLAGIMAFVLWLTEGDWYYFFITPLVVALPLIGGVYAACRFGKCRAPAVAAGLGVVTGLAYYVGYWQFSYMLNVRRHGEAAVAFVEEQAGAKGLAGYFQFRCKTGVVTESHGPAHEMHRDSDEWKSYCFYALELLFVPGAVAGAGLAMARKVFWEDQGVWTQSRKVTFRPLDAPALAGAIQRGDWRVLYELPKAAAGRSTGVQGLVLELEFPPVAAGAPAYLSLRCEARVSGISEVARSVGGKGNVLFRQRLVPGGEVPQLFDALGFGAQGEPRQTRPPMPLPAVTTPATGAAAATMPAGDFREAAVAASRRMLQRQGRSPGPGEGYFCLPVAPDAGTPVKVAGIAMNRALGLFGGGVLGGVFVGWVVTKLGVPETTAVQIMFGGMAIGIIGGPLDAWILVPLRERGVRRRLAAQPDSLLDPTREAPGYALNVWDMSRYHLNKKRPDDYVFCQPDPDHQRLLIEGVRFRYVIRAADLVKLEPVESTEWTSILVSYRAGDEMLSLILARRDGFSALAQHHLFLRLLFPKRDAAWLLKKLSVILPR